jgi:DNA end-binding protein Ku
MGMLLRYPYEVRDSAEYFDDIKDAKITKHMLDLAKHIVQQNQVILSRRNLKTATKTR